MTLESAKSQSGTLLPRTTGNNKITPLVAMGILTFYLVSILFSMPFSDSSNVLIPGIVHCFLCVYCFFQCGKRTINASSIASYGDLVFIGFPAVYGGLGFYDSPKSFTPTSTVITLSLAFLFQLIVLLCKDSHHSKDLRPLQRRKVSSPARVLNSNTLLLSILLFAFALGARLVGLSVVAGACSWIALLLSSMVVFFSQGLPQKIRGLLIMAIIFLVEFSTDLGGFGRLNLAVLTISVATVASYGCRSWWIKFGTTLMTAPTLIFLANQRVEFLQEERGTSVETSEGIGSVVGPFHSAATIVEALLQNSIELSWGATLFAAAVIWIPRDLWPDKPIGFGREIVEVTQPWHVSNIGHSDAGTFIGEAVWNFGIWGALIYLIPLIILLKKLDAMLSAKQNQLKSIDNLLLFIIAVVLAACFLNVVWGGIFTATARTLPPVTALLIWRYFYILQNSRSHRIKKY